jgi:energy-coupling factor transporter transmembrane protein EcfT
VAQLTGIGFQPGNSFLHGLDARSKLICFILLTLIVLQLKLAGFVVFSVGMAGLLKSVRFKPKTIFFELRYFFPLLFFVVLARGISTPGDQVIGYKFLVLTRLGIVDGALVSWRLFMIALLGFVFINTTRTSEVRAAVKWFLSPIPFIPAGRIATMLGLIVRFIPVILNQARDTLDAQRARGVENRKNPVYRLTRLAVPLIRRTFLNANHLAMAMEARGYNEERTAPVLTFQTRDFLVIGFTILVCVSVLWF